MALATNSTVGSIVLAGDLIGTAHAPILRPTGVTSGTYSPANFVVDSKGRLVYAKSSVRADVLPLVLLASTSVKGIMQSCTQMTMTGNVLSLTPWDAMTQVQQDAYTTAGTLPPRSTAKGIMQVGNGLIATSGIISIADTTKTSYGIVQISSGLDVTAGVVSITSEATLSALGRVQVGSGLSVSSGVLSLNPPVVSGSVPGWAQIGSGLSVSSGIVSLNAPIATGSSTGLVQIGSNISESSGTISVPLATSGVLGVVQVGTGLTLTGNVISISAGAINTPATNSALGIVQVGTNINVTSGIISIPEATILAQGAIQVGSGLSVTSGTLNLDAPDATGSSLGVVQVGTGLAVTTGTLSLSAPAATPSTQGIVQIGTNINVTSGTISVSTGSSAALGLVNSADTTKINITAGGLNTGSNIPLLNANNNFTAAQRLSTFTASTTSLTPDLTTYNTFDLLTPATVAVATPTGLTNGAEFSFIDNSVGGLVWNSINSGDVGFGAVTAIEWNGSVYCAMFSGTICATSPDGITWTSGTKPTGGYALAWNGSLFCAVGLNSVITSTDGLSWTTRTIPAASWADICWNGSLFCAVAGGSAYNALVNTTVYATSTDGITWTSGTMPSSRHWSSVAWSDTLSMFVAASQEAYFVASGNNGVSFDPMGSYSGSVYNIKWNGYVFCAIGTNSGGTGTQSLVSSNGTSWSTNVVSAGIAASTTASLVVGNSAHPTFCFVDADNTNTYLSNNGINWATKPIISTRGSFTIGTNGIDVVGFGGTTLLKPFNGTFKPQTTSTYSAAYKFAGACPLGPHVLDCVTNGTTIYCSYNY